MQAEELPEGTRYHVCEQATGRFERSFHFNHILETNGVEADYKQGILTLRLPKSAQAKPRRIMVNGATETTASSESTGS